MAKNKGFTDVEIMFCGKKCHFNRVTNKEILQFSEQAEKEYNKLIKEWAEKGNDLTVQAEKLEKEINRKENKMRLLESKEDANIDELLSLNDELEELETQMNKLTDELINHNKSNPNKVWAERVEQILAEKAATFLDNVTAEDYIENGTQLDTCIASNLEKYLQLAMMGEKEVKIKVEIEEDGKRFLQEREDLRNSI